jgi:hypothetical protein
MFVQLSLEGVRFTGLLCTEALDMELALAKVFVSPMTASTGLNTKNVLAMSRCVLQLPILALCTSINLSAYDWLCFKWLATRDHAYRSGRIVR